VILDLERFIREEQPFWKELSAMLDRIERDAACRPSLDEAQRLHYLHQRAASDLARITTFAAEPELRRHLEALVARAYGEIHEVRGKGLGFSPWLWLSRTLPQTFRRQLGAFWMACAVTFGGAALGAFALLYDAEAKDALLPFPHLQIDPAERVAHEERTAQWLRERGDDPMAGIKAQGTTFYIWNNTRVSFITMALGIAWGLGTIIVLFSNGVLLGAVVFDYIRAGEGVFLTAWLLPHGATEIPAILVAGQAGLLIGRAVIGWDDRTPLRGRLRRITPDLATLIGFVVLLLIWAGFVEAFFSQYHEPYVPYSLKIAFGGIELVLLIAYLAFAGRKAARGAEA
jgi:uncharacterized membrane protein SpoIIM required for sporulation